MKACLDRLISAGLPAWLFGFFALLAATAPAEAFTRALLVGVSYVDRPEWRLEGPANDVALMHATLLARGVPPGAIRVLADLLPPGAPLRADAAPTRAAILAGLDWLARESRPGDLVLVLLAGHGSQQPTTPSALEPDGLDEIFLPADIGAWNGRVGRVENAIVDDEIGAKLDAIRAAGAFVVAAFDACHSGSMTRGAGTTRARPRSIPAGALGVPDSAPPIASLGGGQVVPPMPQAPAPVAEQGMVAFFAAQSDQQTFEIEIPPVAGGPSVVHGPLSFALAAVLREGGGRNWRDVAARMLARYEQVTRQALRKSDPLVEGDLDAALPGTTAAALRLAPAEPVLGAPGRLRLMAGRLQGLEPGTLVDLAASEAPERPVVRARILAVGLADAVAEIEEPWPATLPRRLVAMLPDGIAPPAVNLALPEGVSAAQLRTLRVALGGVPGLVLVEPAAPAGLRLVRSGDQLTLVPGETTLGTDPARQPIAVPLAEPFDSAAGLLARLLTHVVAAQRLGDLAAELASAPPGTDLRIEMRHWPSPGQDPRAACPALPTAPPAGVAIVPPGAAPRLRHCDVLYVTLRNTGRVALDVGLFYLHGSGLAFAVPDLASGRDFGRGFRLQPGGEPLVVPLRVVTWDATRRLALPAGPGRVFVVAVRRDSALARSEILDISAALGLAPQQGEAASREPEANSLLALLGGQGRLRSGGDPRGSGLIRLIRWDAEP